MTKKSKVRPKLKSKRSEAPIEVTASPKTTPDPMNPEDLSGKTKFEHTVEVLILEWAFFYGNHSPTGYLEFKGYSPGQIQNILHCVPAADWYPKRETAQNRVTESLVKRHVDIMATVQDEHIKSSKLALAKAVKMLADGDSEFIDKAGVKRTRKFSSHDLLNCTTAIEKAQKIYRTAMGLPNDEAGMSQILKTLQNIQTATEIANSAPREVHQHVHQSVTVNAVQGKTPHELTYDDIMILIEAKREQKAKQLELLKQKEPQKQIAQAGPQDYTAIKRG